MQVDMGHSPLMQYRILILGFLSWLEGRKQAVFFFRLRFADDGDVFRIGVHPHTRIPKKKKKTTTTKNTKILSPYT